RVTTVTDQTAGSRLLASYVWRGDDQMASVTYGNGAVRQYGYDSGNRLKSVENTWTGGSERFDYGYDVGSNRKTEERRVDGQLVRSVAYRHDVEDRLAEAAYTTPAAGGNPAVTRAITWGYDLVGNRTREVGADPATGAAIDRTTLYNDRNEPVTMTDAADPAKNATFAHDANGNLTSVLRGGIETRYAYDGRDQMMRASRVEGGVETVVGEYGYDAERRRTQSVADGVTKRSVWAGQSVAAEVAGGTAVSRYDSGTDLIRSELAGEGERCYGRDAMGTTTSLTSSTGALTARAEYDAWGERMAETGATANRVGFTGYREDAETGLDYAINRYYSPDTGRFTTHDPLTELDRPERLNQPQGLNLYPYVMGGPTRYTDPDGLEWMYQGREFWWTKSYSETDEMRKIGWRSVEDGEIFTLDDGRVVYLADKWSSSFLIAFQPIKLPSQSEYDFILPDKQANAEVRYEGVPNHAELVHWTHYRKGRFFALFKFHVVWWRDTVVLPRGEMYTTERFGSAHAPVIAEAIPRWEKYDIIASYVAGILDVFLAPGNFLARLEGWKTKRAATLREAQIDNPGAAQLGRWTGVLLTLLFGPKAPRGGALSVVPDDAVFAARQVTLAGTTPTQLSKSAIEDLAKFRGSAGQRAAFYEVLARRIQQRGDWSYSSFRVTARTSSRAIRDSLSLSTPKERCTITTRSR
ncbi:MAG: RHS repeat-associated core domain-containing protein, partial [Acidobacteria bacterium]|nr:RHS repeat-associated core domain-containing protein [Acidobacteriota bacterium]